MAPAWQEGQEARSGQGLQSGPTPGTQTEKKKSKRPRYVRKFPGCICRMVIYFIGSNVCVFLLWLILFRPYSVRPHVYSAALAAFDLTIPGPAGGGIGLRYDLTLNLTFVADKSPLNETFLKDQFDSGILFDHLTAGLYYNGFKLGPSNDTFPSFYQLPQQQHTLVQHTLVPKLQGHASNVSGAVAEAFARERLDGWFNLDVRVKTTLTYRSWPYRATYYYEYDCFLHFRAPPGNGTPAVTGGVKC